MAKNSDLKVVGETPPPADPFLDEVAATAGVGVSKRIDDNVLPLVRLLQTNSPEVNRRAPEYVEGAAAGDWYFRNSPLPVVRGEEGFVIQPLVMDHVFVQWKPDRGGFTGKTYPFYDRPAEARTRIDTDSETGFQREVLGMPNGDYLEETFYLYGLVDNKHVWVIPFRSTGLTVARNFNSGLQFLEYKGHPLAIWGSTWRFTTRMASNKKGEWFVPYFSKVSQVLGDSAPAEGMGAVLPMSFEVFKQGKPQAAALLTDLKSGAKLLEVGPQVEPAAAPIGSTEGRATQEPDSDIPF